MKAIRISIVTYNSKDIFKTLDNLLKSINLEKVAISIFDNNSDDAYKRKLEKYKNQIDFIFNDTNVGFGAGHNQNLLESKEEYFIIFNPDILVSQTEISYLYEYCKKNPQVALVSPKVTYPNGDNQYLVRNHINLFDFFLRRQPVEILRTKIFKNRMDKFENKNLSDTEVSKIELASGCFMFVRADAYKDIMGFDESFFMYFEDYDFSRRIKNVGDVIYNPFVEVVHFWERGSHKSNTLFKIFVSSMMVYFRKWGWRFI